MDANEMERRAEWLDETALGFVERMTNSWCKQGLPIGVLASAMAGMAVTCIEGTEGNQAAQKAVDQLKLMLVENASRPPLSN